jgi:glyoxalase family protein
MTDTIPGIHHITAIAADTQKSIDFYTRVLGLRLVKLTVNFDDPGTYHLYFGDAEGTPGSILTFFPFAMAAPGKSGAGVVDTTTFLVPPDALEAWIERLEGHGVVTRGPDARFGQPFIAFADPDGMKLEIAAAEAGSGDAILGFAGATLWSLLPDRTLRLLTEGFGYTVAGEEPGRIRLKAAGAAPVGTLIDVLTDADPTRARPGAGSVHHIAFRVPDDAAQDAWRERLAGLGYDVTPVIDRQYFHSIYFRERGGILFEIATDPPGFAVDEAPDSLGTALKLPARYERDRERIAKRLPPVRLPGGETVGG